MKQSNHYSGTSIQLICGANDRYSYVCVCCVVFFRVPIFQSIRIFIVSFSLCLRPLSIYSDTIDHCVRSFTATVCILHLSI